MINAIIFAIISIILINFFSFFIKFEEKSHGFLSVKHTTFLKGFAAVIIIIQHVASTYGTRIFTPFGGIGVSIFLICSGYGLSKSYLTNNLNKFFNKRLSSVLIPYWIIVIFYNIIHFNKFNVIQLVKQSILISPLPYMWFIQLILILYLLFYIIYKFLPSNLRLITFFVISTLFIIFCKNQLWAEQSFAFPIGIFLSEYSKKNHSKRHILKYGLIFITIGFISLFIKQLPEIRYSFYLIMNINQAILKTITALGIVYLTYLVLNIKLLSSFGVIGKYSYEAYLIHTQFIFIVAKNQYLKEMFLYIIIIIIGTFFLKKLSSQINLYTR